MYGTNIIAVALIDKFSGGITLFAYAFGIIGFVGGAVGYFAKDRASAIISAQAELIDTRDKQIADRDKSIASLTAENATLGKTNTELQQKLEALPKNLAEQIAKQIKEQSV